jgi:hypothetical protein
LRFLRTELPIILGQRTDVLSPRMVHVIEELAGDWRRLDERIAGLSAEITALAGQDVACKRLMTVPGIGPIISSAMVACNRQRCGVFERPRLRRLARTGAQANLDRRSHDPWQDIEAIAICASCSCRRPGLCWSRSRTPQNYAGRDEGTADGTNKGTDKEEAMT